MHFAERVLKNDCALTIGIDKEVEVYEQDGLHRYFRDYSGPDNQSPSTTGTQFGV